VGLMIQMAEQTLPAKLLYEVREVAGMLSLGRSKLYSLILSGELRSVKVGRRRLIPPAAIREFVERLHSPDGEAPL
jgi:excisionase family DNA binding protein